MIFNNPKFYSFNQSHVFLGLSALVLSALACNLFFPRFQTAPEPSIPSQSMTVPAQQPPREITQAPPPTANSFAPILPVNPPGITNTLTPEIPLTPAAPVIPVTPLAEPPLPSYWGLIPAQDGLWVIQPDGFGLHRVLNERLNKNMDLQIGAAPEGGMLAYVSSDPDAYTNLSLKLLHLPEGTLQTITPLLPEGLPAAAVQPGGNYFEAARAIRDLPSLAWSPDGETLAFVSAFEGSSADIYSYNRSDGKIAQLTSGPSQAFSPSWSLDGTQIIHFGATSFGTGAGYKMAGAWAVNRQGTVTNLYKPDSQDENLVGWKSADEFLVNSWFANCSHKDLRSFSISNLDTTTIWPASFTLLAFDPSSKAVVIGVDQYTAQCDPSNPAGSYLHNNGLHRLSDKAPQQVVWSQDGGVFILRAGARPVFITPDGKEVQSRSSLPLMPLASPGGQNWAWPGGPLDSQQGLWIGRLDEEPRQVFDAAVWGLSWAPDGNTLFFFTLDGLYVARTPDFSPQAVSSTLLPADNAHITWLKR
jgi:hypothetical protein